MLKEVSLTKPQDSPQFPFNLPLFQNLKKLPLKKVTFFVGENGSGKSTLLEAIAVKANLTTAGSDRIDRDYTLSQAKNLADALKLSWDIQNHKGFFLRAEDFFGYIKYLHQLQVDLANDANEASKGLTGLGYQLARGSIMGQLTNVANRYGDLNTVSHGEGYLKFFQERLIPGGLYLLDEPEAALSPTRQLSLISLIKGMLAKDCQFIIASHSPILMAFPGALIYHFSDKVEPISYDQIDHVTLTRSFLANPDSFLRHL